MIGGGVEEIEKKISEDREGLCPGFPQEKNVQRLSRGKNKFIFEFRACTLSVE